MGDESYTKHRQEDTYTLLRVQELFYGNVDMTEEERLDIEVGLRRVCYPFGNYLKLRREGYTPLEAARMVGISGNQTKVEDNALFLLQQRVNEG